MTRLIKEAPTSSMHPLRTGFTLIEMLVVIAILALLVSMISPAITSALRKAKGIASASNARQILLARRMYTTDHSGFMIPNRPSRPGEPGKACTWRFFLVDQYGLTADVFRSPGAPNTYSEAGVGDVEFAAKDGDVPSNFSQVSEVFGNDGRSRRSSIILNPSGQLEIVETRDYWADINMGAWGWVWADGYGIFGFWHSGKTTCGYADGHVELKMLSDTVTPVCQWDTTIGSHDGKQHPEYGYMLDHYK